MSLDGTTDRISAAASTDFGFGTADLTIEYLIYLNSISNYPCGFDMRSADNDTPLSVFIQTGSSNQQGVWVSNATIATGAYSFKPGIWTHYAICKTGGYLKGYFNGKEDFSISCTRDYGTTETISIGSNYGNNNYYVDGNIADFRIVKGTAIYTSAFTPPTAPLTAVTNTKLLVQSTDGAIIDKSQSSQQVKLFGDTKSSTTQTKYLSSSISLDGTGDYIELKNQQETSYGTSDFTIETWAYFTAGAAGSAYRYLFGQGSGTSGTNNLGLYIQGNVLKVWHNGAATITGTTTISLNSWYHIALSRNGTNLKLFLNGTQEGSTATNSSNITSTATGLSIGRWAEISDPYYFAGYISDFRITKGLARYTSNFTAPTASLKG